MSKLKNLSALKKIVGQLKKKRKKISFTNGCFDILHPGHVKTFKEAKKKGDILIVGLNSDVSVKKIKGKKRPVMNQRARVQVLEAIESIDYIVIFNEETPIKVIEALRPHTLVKGGDWHKDKIVGANLVKKVVRVKLEKGHSTTNIIKKIKRDA